jgi:uncharacterized protein YndB with AHSA1/START domain
LREENGAVQREETFDVGREELWAALTDPSRLAEWFANEVELEAVPGGEGTFRWADGDERRATVHEVVEGERIAFTWTGEDAVVSVVEFELAEAEGGTRLVVTETPVGDGATPTAEWSAAIGLGALAQHLSPVLV